MAYNDIVGRFFWTPYKDRAVKVRVTKPDARTDRMIAYYDIEAVDESVGFLQSAPGSHLFTTKEACEDFISNKESKREERVAEQKKRLLHDLYAYCLSDSEFAFRAVSEIFRAKAERLKADS